MELQKGLRRELNRMTMRLSMPYPSPEKAMRMWETMRKDHKPYRPARKHPFKRIK